MSHESLEVVKSCLGARGQGDYVRAIGHIHPDVVVDLSARPDGQVYRGREQAASAMREWVLTWDEYVYEVERVIDAGDEVVVFFREQARSKDSGVAVRFLGATVWTVRDGLVVRTKTYTDRKEALEAVGLREEARTMGAANFEDRQTRSPVITRVRRGGPPRRSRNLEERFIVRFPGAWRTLAALGQRLLCPRSRLRRAMLRRAVVSGWDAFSRLDLELMLVRYAPDVEYRFDPQFEALGISGTFRGHEGTLEVINAFGEAWGQREVRPMLILDLGDRALILGTLRLPGTASGLEFESEYAQLLTPRGGVVAHEQDFLAWDRGLEAAGLEPQAFAVKAASSPRR